MSARAATVPSMTPVPEQPRFLSKSDYAYEVVKQRILSEELGPGAVISQERIATEIGVSTTPLREALKRLATEGLVSLGSYRDARVTTLSADEARSLYEVRLSLDPLAAGLAAERRTGDDVVAINDALQRLEPLSGAVEWEALIAHRAFHRAVYRASANAPLVEILEGLWDKADRYRQAGLREHPVTDQDRDRVRAEHEALAAAVVAGDVEAASDLMHAHVHGSLGRRAIDDFTT
jgi:DNA-binding GntR family transcriptional regulator